MHLQGGDLFLGLPRVRQTGELKVVVGCVVTGTVGTTGGKVSCPVAVRLDMFGTEALVSARSSRVCSWHSSAEMHQHAFLGSRNFPKFQKVVRLPTALTISCPWDLRSRTSRSCRPPSRRYPLPLY